MNFKIMIKGFKWFLLFNGIILLMSCGDNRAKPPQEGDGAHAVDTIQVSPNMEEVFMYSYRVASREVSEAENIKKVEYTVIIPEKYDEAQLSDIADELKKKDAQHLRYVFVSFYLKGQSTSSSNYGISKKTPKIDETMINYTEPSKEVKSSELDGAAIVGRWSSYGGLQVVIYKKKANYYMLNVASDGSAGDPDLLRKVNVNGLTGFQYYDDDLELFVIMRDGLHCFFEGQEGAVYSPM